MEKNQQELENRNRSPALVNNKKPGPGFGRRPVTRLAIGSLIALAGLQCEASSIREFSLKLPLQAKDYMPLRTPVIRQISRRILHHPDSYLSEILRPPQCPAGLTAMFGRHHLSPISGDKRKTAHLHEWSIARTTGRQIRDTMWVGCTRFSIRLQSVCRRSHRHLYLPFALRTVDSIRSRDFRCRNVHFNPTGASARKSTGSGLA